MTDNPLDTARLQAYVDRWRAGDAAAADALLRATAGRLEGLARGMLRGFPAVRAAADTGDVTQGAAVRLLAALRAVRPPAVRDYYRLAALQIRRELLTLARQAARTARPGGGEIDAPDVRSEDAGELELWCRFHEAVERLPAEERETFGLVFYHGWPQARVAELFAVTDRTVRRWWASACGTLHAELGGRLPAGGP